MTSLIRPNDLEEILVADAAGPHRLASDQAPVLSAVLRVFDPAETDSRLLLTSRFTFALNGLEARLEPVQLRPLSTVAQRKLQRRQQALTRSEQQVERAGLAARALTVSRGNPGLQDLIGLRLVYGEQVPLQRAEAAVAGMETYLHHGQDSLRRPSGGGVEQRGGHLRVGGAGPDRDRQDTTAVGSPTSKRQPQPRARMSNLESAQ